MSSRVVVAAAAGVVVAILAFGILIATRAATLDAGPAVGDDTTPVAAASAASTQDGGFRVWDRNPDGTPVRWDPCGTIRWVLDETEAPEGARDVIATAMARITDASGLTFEYLGTTRERPARDRSLVTADGDEWAPVLITWVPGGSTDLPLGDTERGVTVPVSVRDGGPQVFVTGQVLFNSDRQLLPGFEDRHASWGAVVLHELAHLVGLDHVDDPAQLMTPTAGFGPVELGDGDLAGLAVVGADSGCLTEPMPQDLEVAFD